MEAVHHLVRAVYARGPTGVRRYGVAVSDGATGERSSLKIATARRRLTAITYYHRLAGIDLPGRFAAVDLLRSAQRQRAERPRRSRPLEITELRQISELWKKEGTPKAIRDRAMLLVGFASALRRSSIVALTLDDLEFTDQGVILTVIREKQDQEAKGRYVAIPNGKHETTCAVGALRSWLAIRAPKRRTGMCCLSVKGRRRGGLRTPACIGNRQTRRSVAGQRSTAVQRPFAAFGADYGGGRTGAQRTADCGAVGASPSKPVLLRVAPAAQQSLPRECLRGAGPHGRTGNGLSWSPPLCQRV